MEKAITKKEVKKLLLLKREVSLNVIKTQNIGIALHMIAWFLTSLFMEPVKQFGQKNFPKLIMTK